MLVVTAIFGFPLEAIFRIAYTKTMLVGVIIGALFGLFIYVMEQPDKKSGK